jgi:hypothetical protein
VMRSSANSTAKTWYLSLSPLTPGHNLARCYSHSSPPHTIHVKNLGAPHTLTTDIIDPTPTSCTNAPPNHHAHSGSSHPQRQRQRRQQQQSTQSGSERNGDGDDGDGDGDGISDGNSRR